MLRIEISLFSGRPNPVWYLTDGAEVERLLGEASGNPEVLARPGAGFDGLGFREVRVEFLDDAPAKRKGVPRQFALASTASRDFKASGALAQRLIEAMPLRSKVQLLEHALTPLDAKLRESVLERLQRYLADPPRPTPPPPSPPPSSLRTTIKDEKCGKCEYEVSQYNPGFWNGASVVGHNNCYNYARNWRTNTFAQPGRAHGAQTSIMACNTVSAAAMADGLRKRCDCLGENEYPRRLMALVIDPGHDYHWYRHQRGGFWGHKPGGTPARNYDNSGLLILNPETCNRGGYTQFCGYFYAGRSVVIN